MPLKNQYVDYMNDKYRGAWFDATPKATFAAIAFSLALRLCQDNFTDAFALLKSEGITLFINGILKTKPKR